MRRRGLVPAKNCARGGRDADEAPTRRSDLAHPDCITSAGEKGMSEIEAHMNDMLESEEGMSEIEAHMNDMLEREEGMG
jgi:hypothetical protein